MPADGSRLLITSQNATFVLMPMPSGVGQIMSASSVLGGTAAGGAGFFAGVTGFRAVCVCASTGVASVNVTSTSPADAQRSITSVLAHAGQAGRGGLADRRRAAPQLDQLEELHPGARLI